MNLVGKDNLFDDLLPVITLIMRDLTRFKPRRICNPNVAFRPEDQKPRQSEAFVQQPSDRSEMANSSPAQE